MRSFFRYSAAVLALALLCACGGGPAPTPSAPTPSASQLPSAPTEEVLPYSLKTYYGSVHGFSLEYDPALYEPVNYADGAALWGDTLLYISLSSADPKLDLIPGLQLQNDIEKAPIEVILGAENYPAQALDASTEGLFRRFYVVSTDENTLLIELSCPLDRPDTSLHLEVQQAILDTLTVTAPDPDRLYLIYADALDRFRTQYILPDGQPSGYDPDAAFGDTEENRFAIWDVDGDGQEELLLEYSTTIVAGWGLFVFDYTGNAASLRLQECPSPGSTFYSGGLLEAIYSHNHTHSDFWPYALHRYDPVTGEYEAIASVYACERTIHPDNFPNSADPNGEGIVFYVEPYSPQDGTFHSANPISRSDYSAWRQTQMDGAEPLPIEYHALTEENIHRLRQ